MFPIVVCGNHFPSNPVTRNYIKTRLSGEGLLQDPGTRPLAVIDLDELESAISLAKADVTLPDLLTGWLTGPYAKGSLTLYLWATYGGNQLERPATIAASLREAMDAVLSLVSTGPDDSPGPTPCPAASR